MPKYRFRLETVRKLRSLDRDRQRAALAEAYQAEEVLAGHRAELANEQAQLRELQRASIAGGHMDVNRLAEAQRYEMVLKADELSLAIQTEQLAVETERRRLAVVEADRAVRTLDLLDERQRREHRQREQQRETKELDEIATMRRPQR